MKHSLALLIISIGLSLGVQAQEAVFQSKSLTPEAALMAAKAALESCRDRKSVV